MINGIPTWHPAILPALGITEDITSRVKQFFAAHLGRYIDYLGRKEHRGHFITMLKGFLSDLERKSIEPIALTYGGRDTVRNTTFFMSKSKWDDAGMHGEYRDEASELLSHEEGMQTIDGTDFPKKGRNSVGVARQYCGRLGKTDNCQASVMSGYVSPHGYALIDYDLYMPKTWFDVSHAGLRKACGVPANLEFKTKNAIATEMIRKTADTGLFPAKYVGADASFGSDSGFLDSLPSDKIYFADVRSNQRVFVGRPDMILPPYSGKGRKARKEVPELPSQTVKEITESDDLPWTDVVLAIGAKGPVITKDKCLRVVEVRDGKPGKDVWLYVRMLADGSVKYALCNESAGASAEDIRKPALMRWSIEQSFNECKDYLGMDHYESRSWDAWRRHMLLCLIAHLFIVKLRMEFSCDSRPSGPAPYIDAPVPLDEYLSAAENMLNGKDIAHPSIVTAPKLPQQILTIGLVRDIVSASFVKVGKLLENIDYYLHSAAQAFDSHSKSSLKRAFAERCLSVQHICFENVKVTM
jgi:SRSO17 transposase